MSKRVLGLPLVPLVGATVVLALAACGQPRPAVDPQGVVQSASPDTAPATNTSGLGTPGGYEDAGLPRVATDGSVR